MERLTVPKTPRVTRQPPQDLAASLVNPCNRPGATASADPWFSLICGSTGCKEMPCCVLKRCPPVRSWRAVGALHAEECTSSTQIDEELQTSLDTKSSPRRSFL